MFVLRAGIVGLLVAFVVCVAFARSASADDPDWILVLTASASTRDALHTGGGENYEKRDAGATAYISQGLGSAFAQYSTGMAYGENLEEPADDPGWCALTHSAVAMITFKSLWTDPEEDPEEDASFEGEIAHEWDLWAYKSGSAASGGGYFEVLVLQPQMACRSGVSTGVG